MKPFHLKYKICYQNKINLWNSKKILKFNNKKWDTVKRSKKYLNFSPIYFNGKINMRFFFKNNLFLKRVMRLYGARIPEKQFYNLFKKSAGKTPRFLYFLNLLEKRLDISLFRTGLFSSVFLARQFISHSNLTVNGKLVKDPSILLKSNDLVVINPKSFSHLERVILSKKLNYEHLEINYNSLSYIYLGDFSYKNLPFVKEGSFFLNYMYKN